MDCIIDGHLIRPFCAAIACLSRVGKEINFDFDPIDGLTLRTLNDSKSIFSSFHFDPSFSAKDYPYVALVKQRKHKQGLENSDIIWGDYNLVYEAGAAPELCLACL